MWPRGDERRAAADFLLDNLANKFSVIDVERLQATIRIMDSIYAASTNQTAAADNIIAQKARDARSEPRIVPDGEALHPDSLRRNIEHALATWRRTRWRNLYSFDQFLEYVLPCRVATEPLEYYWREDCISRYYNQLPVDADVAGAATEINSRIDFRITQALFGTNIQSYSQIKRTGTGKCDDMATLTVMAMRAGGIPSAFEVIPAWGSINNGHSFCALIRPDGSAAAFQGQGDNGKNEYFIKKVPKIYRYVFSIQDSSLIGMYRATESVPRLFANCDLMDATACHAVDVRDLQVAMPDVGSDRGSDGGSDNRIAYLAVFSAGGIWKPVAYAANRGRETIFCDMGTGFSASGVAQGSPLDENMGEGILYMPCFYGNGQTIPAALPVVLSKDTTFVIKPGEEYQKVTLTRKYPRQGHIVEYAAQMVGGVFEGANRPDFADAVELFYIIDTPLSHMQRVAVGEGGAFRYVRFRKPGNRFSLAEMRFIDKTGGTLQGKLIACGAFEGNPEIKLTTDGDPLSYFSLPVMDGWIGLDLGREQGVAAIEFCPRTDDNDIRPGDSYRLFGWDGRWVDLGGQKAVSYELTFDRVPCGALLWLRNITRGREERPFIYRDGRQIWW
ncbi:hypothetical protein FACS1894159_02140 [Bacteroidia bacterium]|nr:hypothetical protein FACS1894159_02140 [Bacteroidia bacterium]